MRAEFYRAGVKSLTFWGLFWSGPRAANLFRGVANVGRCGKRFLGSVQCSAGRLEILSIEMPIMKVILK